MPVYEVTSPDGRTFEVTAPEGASKADVLAYAQSKLGGAEPTSRRDLGSLLNDLEQRQAAEPQEQSVSTGHYLLNQAKRGAAASLGMPADTLANVLNMLGAGYGVAKHELTGSTDLPGLLYPRPPLGSAMLGDWMGADNAPAPNRLTANLGHLTRDLTSAAIPVTGMASRPALLLQRAATPVEQAVARTQSPTPILATGMGIGALASAGGQGAEMVAPEEYKPQANMLGQMGLGVVAPSMLLSRLQAIQALRNMGRPENTNRLAAQYVENKIRNDVKNYPGAADRLEEALALQQEIPGLEPRIGQASGVPSLLDMERRVATSGPEQFNRRAIQDEKNRLAIAQQAERDLPLLTSEGDINSRLRTAQSDRLGLAEALPEVDAAETGQTLRAARSSLKGKYDELAQQKFSAPVEEAKRLNVRIDPSNIEARVHEMLANPILQFDETNMPGIARKIAGRREALAEGSKLVNERGQKLDEVVPRTMTFDDLKGMREAVNQDIARERTSFSPNARQRLRALVDIRSEIDDAAQQAPDSVRKLYNQATDWYRDVYAPKFLRGINAKQAMSDITGEQRIPDERLAGRYFQKMASTPTDRFVKLYGDSPQAMKAMENHVLDTYRREVVKDGVIDPAKHDAFIRNYGQALKQLPEMRTSLDSMGNAARLLSAREEQLSAAQSLLSKAQLDKLRYEDHGTLGIDPSKVSSFLKKNGEALREQVAATYGAKVADSHMENLQKIAKAASIAERGRLSDNAFPAQSTNPIDMRSGFGFSSRTVFNMLRAVTTGRTSTEDMGFTLGVQGVTHRLSKALIAAEEKAISDPQTAKLIADSLRLPIDSEAGKVNLRKILEQGGLFIVKSMSGSNNYGRVSKFAAPSIAARAASQSNANANTDNEDSYSPPRRGAPRLTMGGGSR